MEQFDPQGVRSWTIRRAELTDVNAVARRLGVPQASAGHPLAGASGTTIISATRLVLAHVALELGEFWVAADADNRVLAAVVLLPSGDGGQERLQLALRLELGLLLPPAPAQPGSVAEPHWLLLAAVPRGGELMLIELLAAAMPAVDASGLPVLSLHKGPPARAITAAGFEPLAGRPALTASKAPASPSSAGPPSAPEPAQAPVRAPAQSLAPASVSASAGPLAAAAAAQSLAPPSVAARSQPLAATPAGVSAQARPVRRRPAKPPRRVRAWSRAPSALRSLSSPEAPAGHRGEADSGWSRRILGGHREHRWSFAEPGRATASQNCAISKFA